MSLMTFPPEVLTVIRNQAAPLRRRPRHRDGWSGAERRLELTMPKPQDRRRASSTSVGVGAR